MSAEQDAQLLIEALAEVEQRAKGLRWAAERPWRCKTHIRAEGGLAVVDLHDLNAKLGKLAAKHMLAAAPQLSCGALLAVVGVGRRSAGPPVLQGLVAKELSRGPYKVRMAAMGRIALITDPSVAPASAVGGADWGMRLWWLLVAAAIGALAWNKLG